MDDLDRLEQKWWADAAEHPDTWRRWLVSRAEGHREWPTRWALWHPSLTEVLENLDPNQPHRTPDWAT